MKKLLLLLIIPFLSFGQNLTYVPDDAFEEYIEAYIPGADNGLVNDNYVNTSALNAYSNNWNSLNVLIDDYASLNLTPLYVTGITDLTGIEDFVGLCNLVISQQLVTYIDLSETEFKLGGSLTDNLCIGGGVTVLNCPNLTDLILPEDTLKSISVSSNLYLECVSFNNTTFGTTSQFVNYNTIEVSNNNFINSLDLSSTNIIPGSSPEFTFNGDNLSEINLKNGDYMWLGGINIGLNVSCVQVDDVYYSQNLWSSNSSVINDLYSTSCFNNLNCSSISILESRFSDKYILKKIDILGRKTTNNKGFQLHIYDDGTVEKKYLIK